MLKPTQKLKTKPFLCKLEGTEDVKMNENGLIKVANKFTPNRCNIFLLENAAKQKATTGPWLQATTQ